MISGAVYGSHSFRRWTIVFTFFDSPKSHNLTREKSDRNTKMLSSFTSRWQMSLKANETFRVERFAFNNGWVRTFGARTRARLQFAALRASSAVHRCHYQRHLTLDRLFEWTENDNQISIYTKSCEASKRESLFTYPEARIPARTKRVG